GGLTEWVMRLPMLLSGIGLLLVVPPLLRRETTLPVRAAWVALLAISPLLVYHSKMARPYALTSLLTFIAIVAFRRWWLREGATKGWGAAYIAATLLAGWLHPTTLPFTFCHFCTTACVRCSPGDEPWPARTTGPGFAARSCSASVPRFPSPPCCCLRFSMTGSGFGARQARTRSRRKAFIARC